MAEVPLFHHAQGLTAGCRSFAAGLRAGADECVLPPRDDLDAARRLVATTARAELFPYPGDRHLLAGDGLPDDDRGTATPLGRRGSTSSTTSRSCARSPPGGPRRRISASPR